MLSKGTIQPTRRLRPQTSFRFAKGKQGRDRGPCRIASRSSPLLVRVQSREGRRRGHRPQRGQLQRRGSRRGGRSVGGGVADPAGRGVARSTRTTEAGPGGPVAVSARPPTTMPIGLSHGDGTGASGAGCAAMTWIMMRGPLPSGRAAARPTTPAAAIRGGRGETTAR